MYFNINSTGLPVSFEVHVAIENEDSPVTSKKILFCHLKLSTLIAPSFK